MNSRQTRKASHEREMKKRSEGKRDRRKFTLPNGTKISRYVDTIFPHVVFRREITSAKFEESPEGELLLTLNTSPVRSWKK